MTGLFKIFGLAILFLSCALFGFFKSFELKRREENLRGIISSLNELSARIKTQNTSIASLVERCFSKNVVRIEVETGEFTVMGLEKQDKTLLEEFFSDIGMRESDAEHERTRLYCGLFKERLAVVSEECSSLCRLYNTLGILFGVFICIFFL